MPALKKLQNEFQDYLMHGNMSSMLTAVSPDERFSADKRLKVYFDAYRIRLMEILKLDFPKTHTLLGDEEFENAFHDYLSKHPSQHFSVRYFGQYFSEFLKSTAPYQDCPVFAEMAQFEWSVNYTIDAEDADIVTQSDLSKVAPENWSDLCFQFHPSVTSQYYAWDTPQLWQHIENEKPPRQPEALPAPIRWIFWRKGQRCLFQSCTPLEDKMFISVVAGIPFGEICEGLISLIPEEEIPMMVAQTLLKWISEEMIGKIYQTNTS